MVVVCRWHSMCVLTWAAAARRCRLFSSTCRNVRFGGSRTRCFRSVHFHAYTHTHNGLLSRTAQVGRYQKKHSSTHTHPDHRTYFFIFLHLLRSSLFSLRVWQSSLTTSLQVLVGLPLGLGPSTSYSVHFFTQSWSYLLNTCPYHHRLFCCNTSAMSSTPSLSLSSLLGNLSFSLMPHVHLTILISARWSATTFLSLQARSHFHATYCFAHNCCTTFLS